MIENMDWNIGRMLDKLKQLNLDDNTLVIFTSDNGGLSTAEGSPTTNGPLRAGKGWLYEGGIRVPLIMYWKGKIIAGTTSDLPVTTADLFPTIAKAINENYRKEKSIDGENILQMLTKPQAYQNRKLLWHYPHYSNQGGKPGSAIREGNYKLIYNFEDETVELYDVVNDISEKNNIASAEGKTANQLKKKLFKWLGYIFLFLVNIEFVLMFVLKDKSLSQVIYQNYGENFQALYFSLFFCFSLFCFWVKKKISDLELNVFADHINLLDELHN